MNTKKLLTVAALLAVLALSAERSLFAQQPATPSNAVYKTAPAAERPYAIEYYYKAKWGHADEFLALFKKNHLPLLLKEVEFGRLLSVTATTPRYHTTEDGRWDFRVTIVFKNAAAANDDFDEASLARQLYPDQEVYKREEQRRFEILEAHWDLPIKPYDQKVR
jgi:hypothetical protein